MNKLAVRASPFAASFFFPGKFFSSNASPPPCHSRTGVVSFFLREDYSLFRWPQFQSECQDFLHGSQPVWELRIQGYTFQIVPDPQPHQVVARKPWPSLPPVPASGAGRAGSAGSGSAARKRGAFCHNCATIGGRPHPDLPPSGGLRRVSLPISFVNGEGEPTASAEAGR